MTENTFLNKNLLIITPVFPNEKGTYNGGVFVKDQVDVLRHYFKEIIVIAPILNSLGTLDEDSLCKDYKYENVRVHFPRSLYIPWPLYRRFDLGSLYYDNRWKVVEQLIEEEGINFDLIHTHFAWPSGDIGYHLKKRYDVPVVMTLHGYDIYEVPFLNKIWEKRIHIVLNSVDAVITVSNKNADCIRRLGITRPVHIIPNGFREDLFYPRDQSECRNAAGLPLQDKILLTVGNLVEVKGHQYLVEAMAEVVKKRQNVLCFIVGRGALKRKLKQQIRVLGLEDRVRLVGSRPHREIPLWMNACDVFILPSLKESFGIVQLEALACGKPVVASLKEGSEMEGVGDIIVSDEYGYLVRPGHSNDLAEKILIALEKKWDSAIITEYVGNYGWNIIIKRLLYLYVETLAKSIR